jgi:hypothetical protein
MSQNQPAFLSVTARGSIAGMSSSSMRDFHRAAAAFPFSSWFCFFAASASALAEVHF